jgi:hypothetical protein
MSESAHNKIMNGRPVLPTAPKADIININIKTNEIIKLFKRAIQRITSHASN